MASPDSFMQFDLSLDQRALLSLGEECFESFTRKIQDLIHHFLFYLGTCQESRVDHPPQQIISEPVDETASAIEGLLSRIHPHDRQTFQSSLLLAAQTLQPWVWEGQLVTPSGDIRSVRANFQPYPQKAGELVWQGDLADVTEQSDADEQDFVMEIAWRYMHYSHW